MMSLSLASDFVAGLSDVSLRADKGFGNLLKQEIANIGAENVGVLSPAICPDCPSGSSADNDLSQRQLYERMDLVCAAGITDFSVFTFFEVAQRRQHRQLGRTLAERYFAAFEYFRTGRKPLAPREASAAARPPLS